MLRAINAAWTQGDPASVGRHFHEAMVIAQPTGTVLGRGREACVASYVAFAGAAEIHRFEADEASVEVWGETAVASYRYAITYSMEGSQRTEAGIDLFVFARTPHGWQAVWRAPCPAAAEPAD